MKKPNPRTPERIRKAAYYRNMVKHKDAMTRQAVDRIVHYFVCPDADGVGK